MFKPRSVIIFVIIFLIFSFLLLFNMPQTDNSQQTMIYRVEIQPLIDNGLQGFYYPLYQDKIVFSVKRNEGLEDKIKSWQDLREANLNISLPSDDMQLQYIWMSMAYAFTGKLDYQAPVDLLKDLHIQSHLLWDDPSAPIRIGFISSFLDESRSGDYSYIIPLEGGLSFEKGLYSKKELTYRQIEEIFSKEQPIKEFLEDDNFHGDFMSLYPAENLLTEILSFGNFQEPLQRDVLNKGIRGPFTHIEHHLISLLFIIIVIFWNAHTNRRIIHKPLNQGNFLTALFLMGGLSHGIVRFAINDSSYLDRLAWYLVSFYILSLPVLFLFIAENSDNLHQSIISNRLKRTGLFATFFFLLIVTNDYHQWIFTINPNESQFLGLGPSVGLAFIFLSVWYFASLSFSFLILIKKSMDSPGKSKIISISLVFILALLYFNTYNFKSPFTIEYPPIIAVSFFTFLFWALSIRTGLVPTNQGYFKFFELSHLDSHIIDSSGNCRYRTSKARPLDQDLIKKLVNENDKADLEEKIYLPFKDDFFGATKIKGGWIVSREDISFSQEIKEKLKKRNIAVYEEGIILNQKKQLEKKLNTVKRTNFLNQEIKNIIEKNKDKMVDLLDMEDLNQFQRRALYTKRMVELLIKSQEDKKLDLKGILRLFAEISQSFSESYILHCNIEAGLEYFKIEKAYSLYYKSLEIAHKNDTKTITGRLMVLEDKVYLHLLMEKNPTILYSAFLQEGLIGDDPSVIFKEIDEACSISYLINGKKGGRSNV